MSDRMSDIRVYHDEVYARYGEGCVTIRIQHTRNNSREIHLHPSEAMKLRWALDRYFADNPYAEEIR